MLTRKSFKSKIAFILILILIFLAIINSYVNIIISLCAFLCIVSICLSYFVFDELIEYEFKKNRSQWEADGKPGFFRWPEEMRRPWYNDPQKELMGKWFISTPNWMKQDNYAKLLIWTYRIFILIFFVGMAIGSFL